MKCKIRVYIVYFPLKKIRDLYVTIQITEDNRGREVQHIEQKREQKYHT